MQIISKERFDTVLKEFASVKPIVVVGDIGIDKYTFGEVRRISPEAPVPILEVSDQWLKLGMAANISHNLKTVGIDSTLCGVVGTDKYGSDVENLLEECDLKTWGLVHCDKSSTILKDRITTHSQQICRIDFETSRPLESATEKKLLDRINDFNEDHGAIIVEDYCKGTVTQNLLSQLIENSKKSQRLIAVDPGRKTPPLYYKGATLLKPNLLEAKMMVESLGHSYQEKGPHELANILVDKLDLTMLVITLGAEGMALLDTRASGQVEIIPTVAAEVYDVSGAGDTTITLLTAALLSGATLSEAAWIANCGAGVVCAKKGTATVNLQELSEFHHHLLDKLQKK